MIKFFRHIRKEQMETGKTANYLKYAIGEIVLVVIGILIALQVNNWNEERKTRLQEHNTLEKLYEESQEIVSYLTSMYNDYNGYIQSINKSAQALKNKTLGELNEDEFAFGVYSTAYYQGISPPKRAFDELNSTGKILNIRSENVRKSISDYYAFLEYLNIQLVYFRNQFTKPVEEGGKDFIYKYDSNSEYKIKASTNFKKLTANDLFISKHVKALRDQIVFNEDRKTLLDFAKKMLQELEIEISKTND
jgi:Family of unknown function (DUF6090)